MLSLVVRSRSQLLTRFNQTFVVRSWFFSSYRKQDWTKHQVGGRDIWWFSSSKWYWHLWEKDEKNIKAMIIISDSLVVAFKKHIFQFSEKVQVVILFLLHIWISFRTFCNLKPGVLIFCPLFWARTLVWAKVRVWVELFEIPHAILQQSKCMLHRVSKK